MAGRPLAPANGLPPLLSPRGREGGGSVSGSGEAGDGAAALGGLGGGEWPVLGGSIGGADVLGLDVSVVQGDGNGGRLLHVGGPSAVGENTLVLDDPLEEGAGSGVLLQQQEGSSSGAYEKTRKNVEIDGALAAKCPDSMIKKGLEKWKNTLMGHFIGGRPSFIFARDMLLKQWKIAGHVEVNLLDSGIFVFHFNLEDDKTKVLEGGPWYVQRRLMILRPWSPDACLDRVDLCSVPVLISLPNLPFHFWSSEALSSIGSVIGKPIMTDKMTRSMERLSYAHLCVKVAADKDLPSSIPVYRDDGVAFNQRVAYDWKPPRCKHCRVFGHLIDSCKFVSCIPNQKHSKTKQEWRVKDDAGKEGGGDFARTEAGQPARQAGIGISDSNLVSLIAHNNKGKGVTQSLGNDNSFGKIISRKSESIGGQNIIKEVSQSNAFALLENLTEEVHYDPTEMTLDPDSYAILLGNDYGQEVEDPSPQPLAIIPNLGMEGDNGADLARYENIQIPSASFLDNGESDGGIDELAVANPLELKNPNLSPLGKEFGEPATRKEDPVLERNESGEELRSLKGKGASLTPTKPSVNFERLKKQAAEIRTGQGQSGKGRFLEDVGTFASAIVYPWAVLGDFNVIRNQNEKIGGDPIRLEAKDDLNNFIDDSELIDLKWKGEAMTWNNRQSGVTRICCKLDRVMVNLAWMDVFRSSEATFHPPGLSNRSPVVVAVLDETNFGPKPFRFFEAWIGREGFDDLVRKGWEQPVSMSLNPILRFAARLRNVKKELRKWNKECIGDVFLAVKAAETELYQTQCNLGEHPDDLNLVLLETQAKVKLWEALPTEEKFLKEKSRVKYIQLGDGNNSFFHKSMICRQHRKHILEIQGEGGNIVKDPSQIKGEAVSFYKKLFGADSVDNGFMPSSVPLQHGLSLAQ
ncbi:uncharacterized protein LOC122647973 [Telopea speciosissima]|uniref:uncharacterized protein LOC122647973 n=1 Tax=Telopea speciosissima TaxID=54955 RepID=UPI001CC48F3C|nr:uncharacterized protein LOC122647973 [Telopea speciosissima]